MAKNRPVITGGWLQDHVLLKEDMAASAVTPARFVYRTATGYAYAPASFKAYAAIVDFTIANGTNFTGTEYAAEDYIPVLYPQKGVEANVFVDETSAAIVAGDYLAVGVDGALTKGTDATAIAIALEDCTPAANTRIKVEVIA